MSILRFEFKDGEPPWTLEPAEFSDLTLLVGVSGVGKTRTLSSLAAVCMTGQGRNAALHGCQSRIEVQTETGRLAWSATTAPAPPSRSIVTRLPLDADGEDGIDILGDRRSAPTFMREQIEDEHGTALVAREQGAIRLAGSERALRMKDTESVVSLLQEEETIAPLHRSLRRVHRSRSARWSFVLYDHRSLDEQCRAIDSLDQLRDARVLMVQKAYILQEKFPEELAAVLDAYRDIFPQVRRITVGPLSQLRQGSGDDEHPLGLELLGIAIAEEGVQGHVLWNEISAGMRRTLGHLLELALAPRGTVFLVDEFENSMGINCLDAVTDLLLDQQRDIQLIMTSHHPYVIKKVPIDRWRVVTRQGSTVRVIPASEVPELNTKSSQDAFIRLINATDYIEGVR
ncbi:MAG: ATP-binding protein [Myxococcales bacterium]|nr:ATP-binding protein [Myxococcales bacterium]